MTFKPEKIPQAMAEKFSAITQLTDSFCEKHLNEEYRQLIHRALGRINFLDDASTTPHCKPKVIHEFFGIAESTGQNKSKEIRELLKMGPFDPNWMLPSRIADSPTTWILMVNGLAMDIRTAPTDLQRLAFEKGLIPYVPADQRM